MFTALLLTNLIMNQPAPAPRTIKFAGREWLVRNTPEKSGPGPNFFSNSSDGVWVDSKGRLNLKVRKSARGWECVEVGLPKSLGYGEYKFTIETPPSEIADNAILGLFTYEDDVKEIDLEVSRWGASSGPDSQFVVQPWDGKGNRLRFALPENPGTYVMSFRWTQKEIKFATTAKGFRTEWTYTGKDIPPPGKETARINLWLYQGGDPAPLKEQTVVVSGFVFTPAKAR